VGKEREEKGFSYDFERRMRMELSTEKVEGKGKERKGRGSERKMSRPMQQRRIKKR
jgi:hypothetical protein